MAMCSPPEKRAEPELQPHQRCASRARCWIRRQSVPGMGKVKMPADQQPPAQQPSTQPQQQQAPAASAAVATVAASPDNSSAPKLVTDMSRHVSFRDARKVVYSW